MSRQSFRVNPKVNDEFEQLINAHGFCKSSVFRQLQERWVLEQKELHGVKQQ